MRPPSASLMSSLHALHVRPELEAPHEWAHAIDEIAEQNHAAIALALAPLILVPDPLIAHTAARALHRVLLRLNEKGILWIAHEGRRFDFTRSNSPYAWRMLQQDDVPGFDAFGRAAVGLYCIGSVHSNGRVRQACVEGLVKYRGALPTAFLFIRLNDWVRPVRDRARIAVLDWLEEIRRGDTQRCQELLDNILLTEYLETWGREDHAPIREAIESALRENPLVWELWRSRDGSRFAALLSLHKYNLQPGDLEPFGFLQRTLSYGDPRIRLWAARETTQRLSGEKLRTLVNKMQKDRGAPFSVACCGIRKWSHSA